MGAGSCLVRPMETAEAQTPRMRKGRATVERQGRLGPGLDTECNPLPASGLHTTCHSRPQEMVCQLWQPWGPGANPSRDNGSRTRRCSGQTLAVSTSARSCRQASTGQVARSPPGHYLATRHQPADPVPGLVGCVLHQRQHMLLRGAVCQAAGIPLRLEHAAVRRGHAPVTPALPAAHAPGGGREHRARFTPFLLLLNLHRLRPLGSQPLLPVALRATGASLATASLKHWTDSGSDSVQGRGAGSERRLRADPRPPRDSRGKRGSCQHPREVVLLWKSLETVVKPLQGVGGEPSGVLSLREAPSQPAPNYRSRSLITGPYPP